jgi:hypothetical protein
MMLSNYMILYVIICFIMYKYIHIYVYIHFFIIIYYILSKQIQGQKM